MSKKKQRLQRNIIPSSKKKIQFGSQHYELKQQSRQQKSPRKYSERQQEQNYRKNSEQNLSEESFQDKPSLFQNIIKEKMETKPIGETIQPFISQFFDDKIYQQKNLNPQFLRIKNNILLIIFVLSSFGIYYLFENFIDVMLLAFIGGTFLYILRYFHPLTVGVSYQQMRERFIKFWVSDEPFFQQKMTLAIRILSIIAYLLLIFFLPWIRTEFGYPDGFGNHFTLSDFIYAFSFKTNLVVLALQGFLMLKVFHLILTPKFFPIIARHAPKNINFYKWTFGILFTLISLGALFIIPSVLAMQVSHGGYQIQKKVQQHLKCRLINYSSYNNQSLPSCSQIFFKNNTFLQETLKEFKAQTSQVEDCMTYLSQLEKRIIGNEFFQYKQMACTSYLIILKASYYFTPDTDMLATGTTFLKTIFGNITLIIMSLSNIAFSVTSFVTIFYSTVSYFNPRSTVMKQIFFGERKELLEKITNLIEATLFIVVEHFILSIVLLQLFNFSNFNMLISTFLSSMAFVPFFRPSLGALFFCIIRSLFIGNHILNIVFFVIYYYLSERIFSFRLKPMQFHEIITNMSILFGIYQFGIAGIFYGPMIIILFRSVHRELLRNKAYTTQDSTNSSNQPTKS